MADETITFHETLGRIEALQQEIDRAYAECNDPELPPAIHENVKRLRGLISEAGTLPVQSNDDAARALKLVAEEAPIPYAGLATAVISYLSKREVP